MKRILSALTLITVLALALTLCACSVPGIGGGSNNSDVTELDERITELEEIIEKNNENSVQRNPAPCICEISGKTEWVEIAKSEGKICTLPCGMFPPCTPLIHKGERITKEQINLLQQADNVYGLVDGKIQVLKNKNENEE